MKAPKLDIVTELFDSDAASVLTNRAARHIEALELTLDMIIQEVDKAQAEDLTLDNIGYFIADYKKYQAERV